MHLNLSEYWNHGYHVLELTEFVASNTTYLCLLKDNLDGKCLRLTFVHLTWTLVFELCYNSFKRMHENVVSCIIQRGWSDGQVSASGNGSPEFDSLYPKEPLFAEFSGVCGLGGLHMPWGLVGCSKRPGHLGH